MIYVVHIKCQGKFCCSMLAFILQCIHCCTTKFVHSGMVGPSVTTNWMTYSRSTTYCTESEKPFFRLKSFQNLTSYCNAGACETHSLLTGMPNSCSAFTCHPKYDREKALHQCKLKRDQGNEPVSRSAMSTMAL